MSNIEHPNSKFFPGNKTYENKKFDRRNDPVSKSRAKRIEEEARLHEEYFKKQSLCGMKDMKTILSSTRAMIEKAASENSNKGGTKWVQWIQK